MKILLLVGVLVSGCTTQALEPCEEDNMGRCDNMFEEQIVPWHNGSSLLVPNRDDAVCVSLGSQDTSGGVLITPTTQPIGGAQRPFVVTPGAPYMGLISGPFKVTPIDGDDPLTTAQYADLSPLDIITWKVFPPFQPKRAAYFYDGVPPSNDFWWRVRGRKRISITVQTTGSVLIDCTLWRLMDGVLINVDEKSLTGTSLIWQPNPNIAGDGTTQPGTDIIDYIEIETAGTFAHVGIEAWDE